MFSTFKKKPVRRDVMAPWKFGASALPTVVTGGVGSGKSAALMEVGRQAMKVGKTVFYFSLKFDSYVVANMADAAMQCGYEDRFFVFPRLGDSAPAKTLMASVRDVDVKDVLACRGAAFFGFDVVSSSSTGAMIARASGELHDCIREISKSGAPRDVVLLVDDAEYLLPYVLEEISNCAHGFDVVVGYSGGGSSAANRDALLVRNASVIILRAHNILWTEVLAKQAVHLPDLSMLAPGEGYHLIWGDGKSQKATVEHVIWSMTEIPRSAKIVPVNSVAAAGA